MSSGIYAIIYEKGSVIYVGQAKDVHVRWLTHLRQLRCGHHNNSQLQRVWNKHGPSVLVFKLLEECPIAVLTEREQHWLDKYLCSDQYRVFNHGPCVDNPLRGVPQSSEHKARIGAGNRGRALSLEHREKLRLAKLGKKLGPQSLEHRVRIGKANSGRHPRKAERWRQWRIEHTGQLPLSLW